MDTNDRRNKLYRYWAQDYLGYKKNHHYTKGNRLKNYQLTYDQANEFGTQETNANG